MYYTADMLDALMLKGDPLADATVDELFETDQMAKFNELMRWFDTSGETLPDALPQVAHDYLEATRLPPEWVDWEVMDDARMFFIENNVHVSTALSFASMPACYALPRVARLLSATHSLEYPARRMAATGQFTVFLMQPNAFEAGGKFLPAAQKVRLLHASIRHHLRRAGRWDEAADGVPINQEDMIGGQMCFSIMVLDALDRLGIDMTEEEADAYYYTWRVVGAILGVDTDAAPPDLASARHYTDLYLSRYLGPSDEGVRLTRQLIELYEGVVPGTLLDPVVAALIRFLIGDTTADWLAVPRSPWDTLIKALPVMDGVLEHIEHSGPIGEWLVERFGRVTTNFELSSLTHGRVMQYAIPDDLKDDYNIKSVNRKQRWTPPPLTADLP